jgi:hypothetical protein
MVGRLLVAAGLVSCSAAAWLPAVAHRVAIRCGLRQRPGLLAEQGDVTISRLHDIWFARLCRELFAWPSRSGLGPALAKRVAWKPPEEAAHGGCVFAICATPWGRLLAAWTSRQPAMHLLIDGDWARRTRPISAKGGAACLRQLLTRLKNGQSVAVIADAFCVRRTCPVTFLGRAVRGSLLGARLAAAAGVPLQPVVFVWEQGQLYPRFGPSLHVGRDRESQITATVSVLWFLENEIRRSPAAWNKALKPPELW